MKSADGEEGFFVNDAAKPAFPINVRLTKRGLMPPYAVLY